MSEEAFAATPYKGLMPYSEEDAPFFFGRDAEREIITANLMASRLTLLYGPSGVGKSSVLRAGVAHHLRRLARENLDETGSPQFAIVVFSSWRDDPIAGLEARVRESAMQSLNGQTFEPVPPSRSLLESFRAWTERLGGELLIILDQFEEYSLYHGQEAGAESFAAQFPRIVNSSDLNVHFLISIRDDALAKLDRFQGQIPTLFENRLGIDHLDRTAARAAIEQPIEQFNRLYAAGRQRVSIEPELVEMILDQVKTGEVTVGEAGRGVIKGQAAEAQIETPYLQLVMNRLWEEDVRADSHTLRLKTLETLGGAQRIVRTHLDAAMKTLPQNEQDVAARVFHYLVTPSGTKIAHTIPDLAGYSELPQEQLLPVMEKLRGDVRILRGVVPPPDQPNEPRYEIFHDVLAPAILDWRRRHVQKQELAQAERRAADEAAQREREATELEREATRQRELEQAHALATEQQRRAEAERQRELERTRLLTWGLIVSGIVVLIMVFLALIAFRQYKKARSGELAAHARENLQFDPELSILLAREALRFSKTDDAKRAMRLSLLAVHPYVLLSGHTGKLNGAAFSPDGKLVVTASADDTARIWNSETGGLVAELVGHEGEVINASFSPDSKYVVTSAELPDTTARVWDASSGQPVARLVGHNRQVISVIFSPDGTRIATEAADRTGMIWDAKNGNPLFTLKGLSGPVAAIAFSPDSKRLVTESGPDSEDAIFGDGHFSAKVWDVATGKTVFSLGHTDAISAVAFSPDSTYVVTASWDKTAQVWNAGTGKPIATLSEDQDTARVISLAVSADSLTVATSSADGRVKIWSIYGRLLKTLDSAGNVGEVDFSPDGKQLVTKSGPDNRKLQNKPDGLPVEGSTIAKVWDVITGKEVFSLPGHKGPISTVAFSPDGKSILTASWDTTARVWDLSTNEEVIQLVKPYDIFGAAFTTNGKYLLTLQSSNKATIWDTSAGTKVGELTGLPALVRITTLSSDGKYVVAVQGASLKSDNMARLWETSNANSSGKLLEHTAPVSAATFSANGKYVVTSSEDKTARVWETSTGNLIGKPLQHDDYVVAAEFSPDGKYLVTASLDKTARLWETNTGNPVGKPLEHNGPVLSARFSPDGKWVATTSDARTSDAQTSNAQMVRVWEVSLGTPQTELKLEGNPGPVSSVVFSRNGKRIVTLSADNIARLWETDNGNLIAELRGHEGAINTAQFTTDMQWVITAGDDRTVRLWEAHTGDLVQVLRGHSGRVYSATSSADGTKVITVSRDGSSRTYACEVCGSPEDLIERAGERVKRHLDESERRKYRL